MERGRSELEAFWGHSTRIAQVLALVGAGGLYLLAGRELALGLLLGAIVSMLRFWLRYRAMRRGTSPGALIRIRLFAYALSGAALGLAFSCPGVFSPWAAIPGLLVMNIAVVAAELLDRPRDAGVETSTGR